MSVMTEKTKKNILIVDDETRVLQGLKRMLRTERHRWNTVFASSGKEALENCQQEYFDVIVSDMRMPNMDGSELLAEVRRRWPETVRMVLTGQCDQDTVYRSIDLAHQFLPKPCDSETLKSAVQRACDLREQLDDHMLVSEISRAAAIPSMPVAYQQLKQELSQETPSIVLLSQIIAKDIGMTAKVIQLVSSNFFGAPQLGIDAAHAARLLGSSTLKKLFENTKAFQLCDMKLADPERMQIWSEHSHRVAHYAKRIAQSVGADQDLIIHAYLSGELHSCGYSFVLFRDQKFQVDGIATGDSVLSQDDDSTMLWGLSEMKWPHELPREQLASAYLTTLWGLPSMIADAILHFQQPSQSGDQAFSPTTALHVAHAVSKACALNTTNPTEQLFQFIDIEYLERIGCADRLDEWVAMNDSNPYL